MQTGREELLIGRLLEVQDSLGRRANFFDLDTFLGSTLVEIESD